ncbi:MAG: DUF309 domain-containing protein [Hyphomicrobiaceae bacterium]
MDPILTWRQPFVPGRGGSAETDWLQPFKPAGPVDLDGASGADATGHLAGVALYELGYFWEAHEVWEPQWMRCRPNSRERSALAGLIQLANACLKIRMGRLPASRRVLTSAQQHWAEARSGSDAPVLGIDASAMVRQIDAFVSYLGHAVRGEGGDAALHMVLAERPPLVLVGGSAEHLPASRNAVVAACQR